MLDLNDINTHYMIITAFKSDLSLEENERRNSLLEDSLFRREFKVYKLGALYRGEKESSFMAIKDRPTDNNELRYDAIELLDQFEQESVIVKYLKEDCPKKIKNSGEEELLGLVKYDDASENDYSYFMNGNVFSFTNVKRYYTPTSKNELNEGDTIEYLNDNKIWVSKTIKNLDTEYENMYKLLIKYNRLRMGYV